MPTADAVQRVARHFARRVCAIRGTRRWDRERRATAHRRHGRHGCRRHGKRIGWGVGQRRRRRGYHGRRNGRLGCGGRRHIGRWRRGRHGRLACGQRRRVEHGRRRCRQRRRGRERGPRGQRSNRGGGRGRQGRRRGRDDRRRGRGQRWSGDGHVPEGHGHDSQRGAARIHGQCPEGGLAAGHHFAVASGRQADRPAVGHQRLPGRRGQRGVLDLRRVEPRCAQAAVQLLDAQQDRRRGREPHGVVRPLRQHLLHGHDRRQRDRHLGRHQRDGAQAHQAARDPRHQLRRLHRGGVGRGLARAVHLRRRDQQRHQGRRRQQSRRADDRQGGAHVRSTAVSARVPSRPSATSWSS